ncbi:hypothetical protein TorRG33x02_270350 [Trema orientale]|uniref:Transmembrane protein n=1 Tax=Trema orientale TaxID=63057 RepID=A0A2P5CX95_TREOI|nr:hypothetical protein TorRG33x02_270350 [Trema orientale]
MDNLHLGYWLLQIQHLSIELQTPLIYSNLSSNTLIQTNESFKKLTSSYLCIPIKKRIHYLYIIKKQFESVAVVGLIGASAFGNQRRQGIHGFFEWRWFRSIFICVCVCIYIYICM